MEPTFLLIFKETHFLSQSILTMLVVIGLNAIALTYLRKLKVKYPIVAQYVQDATLTTLIGLQSSFIFQDINFLKVLLLGCI